MRVCAVCVFWAQTSVTLAIITRAVFNAYCIINHRLHTGWQSWRGTKSTVASQPRSIPDRCWWLLNQLWLPRGSCRCVCVCVCALCVCVCPWEYLVWYIYVGEMCVHRYLWWDCRTLPRSRPCLESPPSGRRAGSVPPPPLRLSHPQPDMKWFVSEFFRMRSFGPKHPHGCCSVYYSFDCSDAWSLRREARNSTRLNERKTALVCQWWKRCSSASVKVPINQIKSILFKVALPQWALQTVQWTTASFFRPSIWVRKKNKLLTGEKKRWNTTL